MYRRWRTPPRRMRQNYELFKTSAKILRFVRKTLSVVTHNTSWQSIVQSPQYASFLEHAMGVFLPLLADGEPQFLAEHCGQQLRKLMLEIIHRLPVNDALRPHVRNILTLMFKLLEVISMKSKVGLIMALVIYFRSKTKRTFWYAFALWLNCISSFAHLSVSKWVHFS